MTQPSHRRRPWYALYPEFAEELGRLRATFRTRCQELLGDAHHKIWDEFRRDLISRTVHESNWQEGLRLSEAHTRELTDFAFEADADRQFTSGPSLDLDGLANSHRRDVLDMKRAGRTVEELAAFNLARSHQAIEYIAYELASRQSASLAHVLVETTKVLDEAQPSMPTEGSSAPFHLPSEQRDRIAAILKSVRTSTAPLLAPFRPHDLETEGQLLESWLKTAKPHDLLHPMKSAYLNFLHRTAMMGIMPKKELGRFRKTGVHVGNHDLVFPPPAAVSPMMEEFCTGFPTILPNVVKYDPVLKAAETSHRFVRIHPYADGNGRVSRLLMNLVLWGHHPPVYLKADGKGRHRYAQALRRADRGDAKPLAALIAMSLLEIYERMLSALRALPGESHSARPGPQG